MPVANNTAPLSMIQVSKSFLGADQQPRDILKNISFDVPAGKKVAIVGRSGSGKSTLLHLAAGIDLPTSGDIRFFDHSTLEMSDTERTHMRRHHVGLLFQFFYLLPHLSVLDNVLIPDVIAGSPKEESLERARDLLERVQLTNRLKDPVQKLSGGEMQRVALCRALIRKPPLLLADEPTGNLDDDNGEQVMSLLFELANENNTALVYVTHSQEYAKRADEVWTLRHGHLE